MNMEINPSEYKVLIVDDVISKRPFIKGTFDQREIQNCDCR